MFVSLLEIKLKSASVRQRAEWQECSNATRGERAGVATEKNTKSV